MLANDTKIILANPFGANAEMIQFLPVSLRLCKEAMETEYLNLV